MPNNIVWDEPSGEIVWDEPSGEVSWDSGDPNKKIPATAKERLEKATAKRNNIAKRIGYGFTDPFVGASQLIGKGVEGVIGKNQFSDNIRNEYSDYGKDAVDPDGGIDFWRMGGGMLNPINAVGPGRIGKAAQGLKYLTQRGLAHAGVNAAQGTLTPTSEEGYDEYWSNKLKDAGISSLIGTTASGGGKVIGKSHDILKKNFADERGIARNWMGENFGEENLSDLANTLRGLRGNVEGEQPVSSWAATADNGRFSPLASIEHNARRDVHTGPKFNQRDAANKQAQVNALNEVIGEGEDMYSILRDKSYGKQTDTPIQQRTADVTGPMYDKAVTDRIHVPEAEQRAINIAQNEDVTKLQEANRIAGFSNDSPIGGATATRQINQPVLDVMDPTLSGQTLDDPFDVLPTDTIGSMQAKLKSISDSMKPDDPNFRNLGNTRRGMIDRMRGASPAYAEADDTFQEMITPQNRADFTKVLRGDLGDRGSKAFLDSVDDAKSTALRAGIPMEIDSVGHVMKPSVSGGQDAIDALMNVRKSARRDVDTSNIMKTDLGKVVTIGDTVDEFIPPLLSPIITSSKRFLKFIGGKSEEQVKKLLNDAALDPKLMADIVSDMRPQDKSSVVNWVRSLNNKTNADQLVKSVVSKEVVRDKE